MPVVIPAEVHTGPSMMRIRSCSTLRFWEPNLQVTCVVPVRGRATAMGQTGFSQHERADAPSRRLAGIAQSLAQKFDQTRVNDPIAALPPTISVSKFVLPNGSVATPAPIELLMEPPVLDGRRT
jgi:hypothetical protein